MITMDTWNRDQFARLLRLTDGHMMHDGPKEAQSWRQLARGRGKFTKIDTVEGILRTLVSEGKIVAYNNAYNRTTNVFNTVFLERSEAASFDIRSNDSPWHYTSRPDSVEHADTRHRAVEAGILNARETTAE